MRLRGFMFTRYVTFIFLVGLSALFFTSGRSATLEEAARPAAIHAASAKPG
jgi:hypothetical protein